MVPWYSMCVPCVFHGSMVFHGIRWYLMRVRWHSMAFDGIRWYLMRVRWHSMAFDGIRWYSMAFDGIRCVFDVCLMSFVCVFDIVLCVLLAMYYLLCVLCFYECSIVFYSVTDNYNLLPITTICYR